jgi:hypothetical protein
MSIKVLNDNEVSSFKQKYADIDFVMVYGNFLNSFNLKLIENYIVCCKEEKEKNKYIYVKNKKYLDKLLLETLIRIVDIFPIDCNIYCKISVESPDFAEIINIFSKYNFDNPGINNKYLILSKQNNPPKKNHYNSFIRKKIVYMIENFLSNHHKNNSCGINISFTEDCINVLRSLSEKSFYIKDGKEVQKEFSGEFNVINSENLNGTLKITLDVNDKGIMSGSEDGVSGLDKPFTFHTHPKKTYDIQKVVYAWPSIEDLETVFNLITNSNGIMHAIAALEGLYVLSIEKDWINKEEKSKIKDIFYHYEIPYPEKDEKKPLTPEEYIYKLNKSKNLPIKVQYFRWNDNVDNINIYVPKEVKDNTIYCKLNIL